jgi:hypothetical protein
MSTFPRAAPLLAVMAVVCLAATDAFAIPAFARRYETSCTTCHTVFPRLNPFGEAFRRNAYRFPGGGDATAEKEEPLPLGSDAHKDLYPNAVWPGQLPRTVPISLIFDGKVATGPHPEEHQEMAGMTMTGPAGPNSPNLAELGGHVMLRTGGTIGNLASFFGGVDFGGHEPVSVERASFTLTPLESPTDLQIKVGRFEPDFHGVSIHRGLMMHQLRLTTMFVGNSAFAPEMAVNGLQASGLIGGRFGWNAGAVESASGNISWQKDYYGRVEGKIGGMRLDGLHADATNKAWQERSITLGGGYWLGTDAINDDNGVFAHNEMLWRAGADAHVILDDFTLDVVYARQHNNQPTGVSLAPRDMDLVFAELSWIPVPILVPLVRMEAARITGGDTTETRWLASAAVNWVMRANLVTRVWAEMGADPTTDVGFRDVALGFSGAL